MQRVPVIQLIGPSGHKDAGTFLAGLEKHIGRLRRGKTEITVRRPRPGNAAELACALCRSADLTIVSAHGGCNDEDAWICDGSTDPQNWLYFSQFGQLAPGKIATRGGLVWDVCTAGKPDFRTALEPHLSHQVTHVGVIGSVAYPDSVAIVPAILQALLLAPGTPAINAATIEAAAEAAKKATARRLFHTRLGHEQTTPASE